MQNLSKVETLQYVATLLLDLVSGEPAAVKAFLAVDGSHEPFVRVLERDEDAYLAHTTSRFLAWLVYGGLELSEPLYTVYYGWVRDTVSRVDERALLALQDLAKVLQRDEQRLPFFETRGCVSALCELLQPKNSMQMKYQAVLCIWVLCFNGTVVARLDAEASRLIAAIGATLVDAKKEKLVRVCLACFRNLLEKAADPKLAREHAAFMVSAKVRPIVQNICTQKSFPDEELMEDAEMLSGFLGDVYDEMSTFDEYRTELISGKLEWSPVHKSERFWRENAVKLNDNKHALVKVLVQQLKSPEPVVAAVAAHDIGEYARYYPRGKNVIDTLDGKKLIMLHLEVSRLHGDYAVAARSPCQECVLATPDPRPMPHSACGEQHPDSKVRYEALIALQKLMTNNWEYLGKATAAAADAK